MSKLKKPLNLFYKHFLHGQQTRVSFTKKNTTTKQLELVHIDLCGPMRTKGMND